MPPLPKCVQYAQDRKQLGNILFNQFANGLMFIDRIIQLLTYLLFLV